MKRAEGHPSSIRANDLGSQRKVQNVTLLSDISEQIRNDIASGRIELGDRLTIDDLSIRYGASHMPVREALRRLAGEGLVAMEPGRGARVREVDRDFVANLFDTRNALEAVLAGGAARHCTPADADQLSAVEVERKELVERGDFAGALRLNRRFHSLIHRLGANPQARELIDRTSVLIVALWHRYGYGPERFAGVASDHHNLIRALRANDTNAAAILAGAHALKAKFDLLAQMDLEARPAAVRSVRRALARAED